MFRPLPKKKKKKLNQIHAVASPFIDIDRLFSQMKILES